MSSLSKVSQHSFEMPIPHNGSYLFGRPKKVDDHNLKIGKCLFVSEAMQEIFAMLPSIANTPYPVLILGETGVGKSTLAEAIHLSSSRKNGPFVRVNCANLNESLMGSELFGHEKGAFTGATCKKPGYFEQANGGSLFLDEIGELSPAGQTALLTVLDDGLYRMVGGTRECRTTARIIAGTNRDLVKDAGTSFRRDLYERLSVWPIEMPSLNSRREEILALSNEFLLRHGNGNYRLSKGAERFLKNANYPGNLRTLENYIKRGVGLAAGQGIDTITEDILRIVEKLFAPSNEKERAFKSLTLEVQEFIRKLLINTLIATNGSLETTCQYLQLNKRTLYRLIKKLELDQEEIQFLINLSHNNLETLKARKRDLLDQRSLQDQVNSFQKSIIKECLARNNGSRKLVAQILNIHERTLYRIINN